MHFIDPFDSAIESSHSDSLPRGLFLIAAPSDDAIYECFSAIAQKWQDCLRAERLWIQGNVPISPALTMEGSPPAMRKILQANMDMISRIELEFGDLQLSYSRTGGHGPTIMRESFFDEIRIDSRSDTIDSRPDMLELIADVDARLEVCAAMVSDHLTELTKMALVHPTTARRPRLS